MEKSKSSNARRKNRWVRSAKEAAEQAKRVTGREGARKEAAAVPPEKLNASNDE